MFFETPLLRSTYFPQDVLLKLENTQPSGSFKSRGITKLVESKVAGNENSHVFACSGGNAGLAAAEAAAGLGVKCTVVVPTTTKPRMIERIRKLGAETVVHGSLLAEADVQMKEMILKAENDGEHAVYCHPFDNPIIWDGHSTMIDEIQKQIASYPTPNQRPGAIVLSCGGGGLYLGVMEGLERVGWADKVPVIVVETEGAPTFSESLKAHHSVTLTHVNTIASSLASIYVPERAVELAMKYNSKSVLVSDAQSVTAAKQFASDHCIIVEPACAATLAVVYSGDLAKYQNDGPVVAIVCGGSSWGPQDVKS